jgi:hypothetical protein
MKKTLLLFTFLFLLVSNVYSQTVYVTKTGAKYHSEGCMHLSKSSRSIDIKDATDAGYQACKVCKPTASNSSTRTSQNFVSQTNYSTNSSSSSTSVQCSGKTQKGLRCKRMTTSSSGRCYQH